MNIRIDTKRGIREVTVTAKERRGLNTTKELLRVIQVDHPDICARQIAERALEELCSLLEYFPVSPEPVKQPATT